MHVHRLKESPALPEVVERVRIAVLAGTEGSLEKDVRQWVGSTDPIPIAMYMTHTHTHTHTHSYISVIGICWFGAGLTVRSAQVRAYDDRA